jgi:hypothetical protein
MVAEVTEADPRSCGQLTSLPGEDGAAVYSHHCTMTAALHNVIIAATVSVSCGPAAAKASMHQCILALKVPDKGGTNVITCQDPRGP